MMLKKLSDLSQSDRPDWVMWQVKDPCPRTVWEECKRKLNFAKASDSKHESIWWLQILSKTLVCLEWGNLTIVNNFKISCQNILISFDLFPKNDNG